MDTDWIKGMHVANWQLLKLRNNCKNWLAERTKWYLGCDIFKWEMQPFVKGGATCVSG